MSVAQSQRLFQALFSKKKIDQELAKMILVLLKIKGEQAGELAGLVRVIRKLEKPIPHKSLPYLVDGCGTGGDGVSTFNISTIASIVAAGAGAHVAKHGNRSISSKCGSADLLEALGVKIDASPKRMLKALRECRIAYFHAPLYHPAFKTLQSLRGELAKKKIRTIFNLAGPLLNPLRPSRQVIGVFKKSLIPVMAEAAKKLNLIHVLIVWNYDGTDELTTTNKSLLAQLWKGRIKMTTILPKTYGFKTGNRTALKGGNPKLNREIASRILEGKDRGIRRDVILLNAAAILYASGRANSLKEGIKLAVRSIDSKAALHALQQLSKISHGTQ
ncbi:MAG: anthranilate phosphoribosyltransferase [Candidatus Omnitrophica bacterium]|nr:anthranilate phosphoribosyltransferase [Candidatus Omnitrophota bacterium]